MNKIPILAIVLVAIGLGSLIVGLGYSAYNAGSYSNLSWQGQSQGMMGQWYQLPQTQSGTAITIEQAKTIAQQYLASLGNSNLAIKEIMEFQYNFYVMYYEKDTGIGAFEMLIWKQTPPAGIMGGMMGGGMMGGYAVGVGYILPEPGPNMMWNTKYGMMNGGIMGRQTQASSTMTVTKEKALQIAQGYLDTNLNGAKVEQDATQFYGHYTIDFTVNGKIAGMLSVNGYTGQVWYHTWHGTFVQEIALT
jgi:hypothetical protein